MLVFKIFSTWKEQTIEVKRNQSFVYIDRGDVDFKPWQDKWYDAYTGALILEGDMLKTNDNSFAVMEFYDGSRVRLNENTEVTLQKVDATRNGIDVELIVESGEIWVYEKETEENLGIRVFTTHLDVVALGTVYAVEVSESEFVRVLEGEVKVLVKSDLLEDSEILESKAAGIGQQISLSQKNIEDLEARKFVNLLEPIDDYWKVTEWYLWNIEEDESPTQYVEEDKWKLGVGMREDVVEEGSSDDGTEEGATIEDSLEAEEIVIPEISATYPSQSPFEFEGSQLFLKGEASLDVTKIVITEFYKDPSGVPYELSRFVPGSGTWNYTANTEIGNLVEGENRFLIHAFNDDGGMSEPLELIVNATLAQSVEEEVPAEEVVEEILETVAEDTPVVEESVEVVEEVPVVEVQLTAPRVIGAQNADKVGDNHYKTDGVRVVIIGSTASTTQQIIVNDWPLSLYNPGSTKWEYFAKQSIGTLEAGRNVYNVYAIDADGNKSPVTQFIIDK